MTQKIEISHRTIIFTVFFLLGLWFLFEIRQIILAVFVSTILMSALNPTVDRLERFRISRWIAILLVYTFILGLLGIVLVMVVPALVEQTGLFISRSALLVKSLDFLGIAVDPNILAQQISQLGSLPANLLRFTVSLFSNLVGLFGLMVISFYLLLERKNLKKYLLVLFGEGEEKKAEEFVDKVEKKLGGWVRGEAILMTVIGLMTYVGLRLLGIDFALPLAILAGILEIVPNIGPTISAIPAVMMGLTISPLTALAVAALYFLVQQTENSLIVPKVMEKVVGINPLVTILSLAIGFKISGIMGAILAIPTCLVLQVVLSEIFTSKRLQNL